MRKLISFLMAIIMTAGSFTFNAVEAFASDEIPILSRDMSHYGYFIYGKTETQALRTKIDYYIDKEGKERMAYCIEPTKNGVSELGSYPVNASQMETDPVIWGILLNGYPNKSLADLDVNNEEEAYYMTNVVFA